MAMSGHTARRWWAMVVLTAVWLLLGQLASTVEATTLHARDGSVGVHPTTFESVPQKLFYFENSEVILMYENARIWRSTDEGRTWTKVSNIPDQSATLLIHHPHAKDTTAIVLTRGKEHYITTDRGEHWTTFSTELELVYSGHAKFAFNAKKGKASYILFTGAKCEGSDWTRTCHEETFYTKDNFKTVEKLLTYTTECVWANGSPHFEYPSEDAIFCAEWPDDLKHGESSHKDPTQLRLVKSDTYFKDDKRDVIPLGGGGAVGLGIVERFLVIAVKMPNTGAAELFVSTDGNVFSRARFPLGTNVQQEAYTVLESSTTSLAIDMLAGKSSSNRPSLYGTLYFSNTDGTHFVKSLEHTNRARGGRVDFERIQASIIQGIQLANVVVNWEDIERSGIEEEKQLATKLSFDNGGRWDLLRPPAVDAEKKQWSCTPATSGPVKQDCALHFHSVTHPHNVGRIFSTSGAPGILVGVGTVGPYLQSYEKSDTFLSTDAGRTWIAAAKGPHKYEILDSGAIIVLVPDKDTTDHVIYSSDHGKSWQSVPLELGESKKWKPLMTILDNDSTSQRMLLFAQDKEEKNKYMVQLDFGDALKRRCDNVDHPEKSKDFELWRPGDNVGGQTCLLGKSVAFYRRKADANCYVKKTFQPLPTQEEICECAAHDYECDVDFIRDDSRPDEFICKPVGDIKDQPLDCKPGDKYNGSSGYRKIPGDVCKNDKYPLTKEKTCQKVDRPIGVVDPPAGRDPSSSLKDFDSSIEHLLYFRKSSVVVMRTSSKQVWRSNDEGGTWERVLEDKGTIIGMGLHETADKRAFFFTDKGDIWMTDDALAGGSGTLRKLDTPKLFNNIGLPIIDFHPDQPDWYTFLGGARDCSSKYCYTEAYITKDNGKNWKSIETWANKCIWARDVKFKNPAIDDDAVFCMSYKYKNSNIGQPDLNRSGGGDNTIQLVEFTKEGKAKKVLVDKGVREFYVVNGIMVVAAELGSELKLLVSVNGQDFVAAQYPPNTKIEKNAFTVLQSTTSGVFLDVGQSTRENAEYGTLFKSNQNGTYYSRMLENTNRNGHGMVDFEKMQGVEGIILGNVVINVNELYGAISKKLRSTISFDDGSTWKPIAAPSFDANGKALDCKGDCSLHLHCHADMKNTVMHAAQAMHSNANAAGVMVGVGNVGPHLDAYNEGNVYITRDAGHTWMEVFKDAHRWALGDRGGLIVIINDEGPTDVLMYSWDFGLSWAKYKFVSRPIRVALLTTEPTSTSLKFVVIGSHALSNARTGGMAVISIDFAKIFARQCRKEDGDFESWMPSSGDTGSGNRCFLGKEVTFQRRKAEALCRVGKEFQDTERNDKTCLCTDDDFECDYNFFRDPNTKECVLFGWDPKRPGDCPKGTKYPGSSGYRKIPASHCAGGTDKTGDVERECGETGSIGEVIITSTKLTDELADYFYFNNTDTVIMLLKNGNTLMSQNGGSKWDRVLQDVKVTAMLPDPFWDTRAWFITSNKELWYTEDKGKSFHSLNLQTVGSTDVPTASVLSTHAEEKGWLLWMGRQDPCDDKTLQRCTDAWSSTDYGKTWKPLLQNVRQCSWAVDGVFNVKDKNTVFCIDWMKKTSNEWVKRLAKTVDVGMGKEGFKTVMERIVAYAVFNEFMVAPMHHVDSSELIIHVTLNGEEWAQAQLPADFKVPDIGYTVLQSTTGSIFLDTLMNRVTGREYGTLFTSNWNGTFYQLSLENTNQNLKGYFDFEKLQVLEEIALINQVSNVHEVAAGATKKLISKITFNDGATWSFIKPPNTDVLGKSYDCSSQSCALHLHSYTSREDKRDQFSASSAVGMVMAVGSVGSSLKGYSDSDTFLSRDAGRSWSEITKDAHKWEFGDHGGLLVLVNDEGPTDVVKYSLDMGRTPFRELKFTNDLGGELNVKYMFSEPKGTGRGFVIVGTLKGGPANGETVAVHLGFDNLGLRECLFDESNHDKSDFEAWNPGSESTTNGTCFFGQQIDYYRRKPERLCVIGQQNLEGRTNARPCECTKADYECEYNHARNEKGECVLLPGLLPPEPRCVDSLMRKPTAYRKLKKSKCQGGTSLDLGEIVGVCGRRRLGGGSWFLIILSSVGAAGAVTWGFIRYRGRMFGRIRLPTDDYDYVANRGSSGGGGIMATATHIIRTVVVVFAEAGEVVVERGRQVWDWIMGKVRRGEGYAPVGAPVGGRTSLDDTGLLDLDDY
ncbi:hypothetical protein SpCBS45565_g02188 [Spizellomyces sp. 'palustris']|nr:hypothetical protein SpCBS45565_g02188 [Spizellomyces sp. 'palustris']